jgi:hypothetical protein
LSDWTPIIGFPPFFSSPADKFVDGKPCLGLEVSCESKNIPGGNSSINSRVLSRLRRWGRQRKCEPFSAHTNAYANASSNSTRTDSDSDSGTHTNSDTSTDPRTDSDSGTDPDTSPDTYSNSGPDTYSDSGSDADTDSGTDANSGPDSDTDSDSDSDSDTDTDSDSSACDLDRAAGFTGNGVNFSRIHTTVFGVGNVLRRQQPGSDCFSSVEFL